MELVMNDGDFEVGENGTVRGQIGGVKYLTAPDMSVTFTNVEIADALRLLIELYRGRYDKWQSFEAPEKYGAMAAALTRARGESMEEGLRLSFENPYYQMLVEKCTFAADIAVGIAARMEAGNGD